MHCVTLQACLVRKQLITFFVRTDSVGCAMYGAVLVGECTRGCGRLQCSEMQQLAEILHCSAASAQLHRVYYSALGGCGILLCPWGCHGSHPTSATFAQTIIIFVFIIISIVFIVFILNISIITVIIVISIIQWKGTYEEQIQLEATEEKSSSPSGWQPVPRGDIPLFSGCQLLKKRNS